MSWGHTPRFSGALKVVTSIDLSPTSKLVTCQFDISISGTQRMIWPEMWWYVLTGARGFIPSFCRLGES
jgi:hypothetical protein